MQRLINHNVYVLDKSSSMQRHRETVVKVFDKEMAALAADSKTMDQETRISVFAFGSRGDFECLVWDQDVLRIPSIATYYRPHGNTALIEATLISIAKNLQIPVEYGDHSFFFIVITDGEENDTISRYDHNWNDRLKAKIAELSAQITGLPENWTFAAMVPDARGVKNAKDFGFPAGNVEKWDTTSRTGVEEAGTRIREISHSYMSMRSKGVRGTKSIFRMGDVRASDIGKTMIPVTSGSYWFEGPLNDEDEPMESFALRVTGRPFDPNAQKILYQHTRSSLVQEYKKVAILAGKDYDHDPVYMGDAARQRLGLPLQGDVRVSPSKHSDCLIFVGSTATNRLIRKGTRALVLR